MNNENDNTTVSGRTPSDPEPQFTRNPRRNILPHQRRALNILLQTNLYEMEMRIIVENGNLGKAQMYGKTNLNQKKGG